MTLRLCFSSRAAAETSTPPSPCRCVLFNEIAHTSRKYMRNCCILNPVRVRQTVGDSKERERKGARAPCPMLPRQKHTPPPLYRPGFTRLCRTTLPTRPECGRRVCSTCVLDMKKILFQERATRREPGKIKGRVVYTEVHRARLQLVAHRLVRAGRLGLDKLDKVLRKRKGGERCVSLCHRRHWEASAPRPAVLQRTATSRPPWYFSGVLALAAFQ